jgi:ribonucleotide reductase beta subunit family protein with ferritin-like domain
MNPTDQIAELARAAAEEQDLEERARPFKALYEHWERNQWSPQAIDFSRDAAAFNALGDEEREGMVWIFAHRFHAEFKVATILRRSSTVPPTTTPSSVLATDRRRVPPPSNPWVYDEVFGVQASMRYGL